MGLIHYNSCPACGHQVLRRIFHVIDYTVSKEKFPIDECENCSLRITQDVPDATSIGLYYKSEDYISHTNTSKGFTNRLYQLVRKRTLASKRMLVQKATGRGKGNLLDVGSGTGSFVNEMNRHGWHSEGIEPDEDARLIAKKLYGINLGPASALFSLKDGSFHAITLWHVLEHVHELHPYIEKLKTLLKTNGKILIAVPNYTSKDAGYYKEYWAAYDVPRHLYHFSPRSMQLLMEKHDLIISSFKPMWYDSFYIGLLSSKYKTGKSSFASAFYNGFRSNLKALRDVKRCSSVIYVVEQSTGK